jgi:hypothetical protein
LPLTTLHLYCSLPLRLRYDDFRSRLEQSLPSLDESTLPVTNDEEIDAVLKILQIEKERKGDEDMADEAGQPLAPVDNVRNAFEILVRNATKEFGFAPRDVYNGVLKLPRTRMEHANGVMKLGCDNLQKLVRKFSTDRGLDPEFSSVVVAVYPRPSTSLIDYDDWEIDFKSIRIAKEAVEWLRLQGCEPLRDMYNLFRDIPESSALAEWVFKAIVHRMFVAGWRVPQPNPMAFDNSNPPVFSTGPRYRGYNTSLPSFAPQGGGTRAVTRVDFTDSQLSNVTLAPNEYYVPTAATDPPFDSFIIDHFPQALVISILQITTLMHKGSDEDYTDIRKITRCVRKFLKKMGYDARVKVAVTYCLVCPDDGSQHKWKMPVGWDECTKINDHHGDGFYIRIPVPRHHGTSCLSTPNFATELNHG